MQTQLSTLKILRALDGREPVYKMAGDKRIFPAGIDPIYGWLSHTLVILHILHVCTTFKKDPTTVFLRWTWSLVQYQQILNISMRADSNTRKIHFKEVILCSDEISLSDLSFSAEKKLVLLYLKYYLHTSTYNELSLPEKEEDSWFIKLGDWSESVDDPPGDNSTSCRRVHEYQCPQGVEAVTSYTECFHSAFGSFKHACMSREIYNWRKCLW